MTIRGSSSGSSKKRTRVLFLAWGFSIHAKRRIQIFIDDPSFEVATVSTYDYGFERTANFLLKGVKDKEGGYRRIPQAAAALRFLLASSIILKQEILGSRGVKREFINQFESLASWRSFLGESVKAARHAKTVKDAVIQFKPDVVFLQTLLYPCYLAFFLPKNIPLVITFWNGDLTWWAQWSGIERRFKKALVTYGLRRAQAITVNSASAVNACLQYGAREGRINLIRYPGVDLERFKPLGKNEAKRQLRIGFEKVVLLPRGLGEYLNSDIIIEAIPTVIRKYPNTLFLFLSGNGKEQEWEKHLQKARQLGAEENVRWDGEVPWEVMGLYYNASDMMVSISSNDSLPNCMLEAMACGTPILMGDIPPIREWVTDGVNGFLVPPRDPVSLSEKIIRALDAPEEMVRAFTQRNLELARRVFDSRRNSQAIKKLVHGIAEYHAEKARQGTHKNRSQLKG